MSYIPNLNLCCTGSVSIVSIPSLVLSLRIAYGTKINVFLTLSARKFITEFTFQALAGTRVFIEGEDAELPLELLSVPTLIAPATANSIAAMGVGKVSHFAASLSMQTRNKVFIAPAMHTTMWEQNSIRRALASLRQYGYIIIEPGPGREISDLSASESSLASVDSIIKSLLTHL
ncbi:flavoprotein [Sinorhizobium meliloti]|uniref:flavoprotein n=1 Tax=Rhizobium meliloti TaxID=382 RepID=UPI000FDC393E|nr:flavoprotein [Sinorhizobium meliloti]RVE88358.1 phosphopantothenate--cysteine ligase family flavoprotein [Sinorhizobium meliloti]RVH28902.1 phosphopantothenate--cysteine ligase family flavoprotein [Sinorhizobium meliloti]